MSEDLLTIVQIKKLELVVEKCIKLVAGHSEVGDAIDKGGYFRFLHLPTGGKYYDMVHLHQGWHGGILNSGKSHKYENISYEKPIRTVKHDHVSSWQSRNPDAGMYGGAVRLTGVAFRSPGPETFIFAFSGLKEEADEAAMLLTAWGMRDELYISQDEIEHIISISHNELARSLLERSDGWGF